MSVEILSASSSFSPAGILPSAVPQGRAFTHFSYDHRQAAAWKSGSWTSTVIKIVSILPLLVLAAEQLKNIGIFIANRFVDAGNYFFKPRQTSSLADHREPAAAPNHSAQLSATLEITEADVAQRSPIQVEIEFLESARRSEPVRTAPQPEVQQETPAILSAEQAEPEDSDTLSVVFETEGSSTQEGETGALMPAELQPQISVEPKKGIGVTAKAVTGAAIGALAVGVTAWMGYMQPVWNYFSPGS